MSEGNGHAELPVELGSELGAEPYRVGFKKPPREHQFKKGDVNNPHGRPKGASILAPLLRMLAAELNEATGEGQEAAILARLAIDKAKKGEDISGILKLMERTDGAVKQQTEHSGVTMQIITKRVLSGGNGVAHP